MWGEQPPAARFQMLAKSKEKCASAQRAELKDRKK